MKQCRLDVDAAVKEEMIILGYYTMPDVKLFTFPDTDFPFFQLVVGYFLYDHNILADSAQFKSTFKVGFWIKGH